MLPSRRPRLAAAARWGCTVACVGMVAAWIASGWVGVIAFYGSPASRGVAIGAGEGTLMAGTIAAGGLPARGAKWSRIDPPLWRWGFRIEAGGAYQFYFAPFWAPTIALGVPAAWLWVRHRHRHHGHGPSHCPKCGYDMIGVPTATCPECGRGGA